MWGWGLNKLGEIPHQLFVPALSPARLELDVEQFDACLDSAAVQAEVEHDLADGRSYGVAATPTFFVNGRQVVGSVSLITFEREIEAALKE